MNIGYDAKRYFHNRTGLGNYSRDLVDTMVRLHPEDSFFLFDSKPEIDSLPRNVIAVPPSGGGELMAKMLWRPYLIRKDMAKYRLDVYHGLSNELPFGKFPLGIKKIVTVHDVIFNAFPKHYPLIDRWIYTRKTAHSVKVADVVVCTSHATANDLIRYYKVDSSKIEVVYQTCGAGHRMAYEASNIQEFRNEHQIPEDSLLYLSSFQTRKNHIQLLKAYRQYKGNLKLVLAGKPGETLKMCRDFIADNRLDHKVKILENLQNSDLPLLYRSVQAFVYPSVIEGFGIPLIEAANAGLPMAVNDVPIFRELAPEGSLYFNASDEHGFARSLEALSERGRQDYSIYLEQFKPEVADENMYRLYGR